MMRDFPDHHRQAHVPAPPWLDALRSQGRGRFQTLGLPTIRQEAWRFTNLAALERLSWHPSPLASTVAIDALPTVVPAGQPPSYRLVLVNGQCRPDLSRLEGLPAGVTLSGLGALLAASPEALAPHLGRLANGDGQALVALNTGHLTDGAVLLLPDNTVLDRPIELVMIGAAAEAATPLAWHPRLLVVAGTGSGATLVEHHVSLGPDTVACANLVTELYLAPGANLAHYKVQRENRASFHLATVSGVLSEGAQYEGFLLTIGGRLTRNEVRLVLNGAGAKARLGAAYLVRGRQLCDTTTLIEHAHADGTSRQMVKGVIDEEAHGVFQGKILVSPGAQRSNGYQISRTLLLSDHARIDAKPELEIYADDVKCSHGATVGDLDDDALFYLRARGIDRDEARALLIAAYVSEAIAEITDPSVSLAFEALASGWLTHG